MDRPGLFLVLEGVEGAGKSTQLVLLASWMEENGVPHVTVREPGGTAIGESVREVLLGEGGPDMPAETELFLMLAARAALVREVVGPALERGEVVLADRFDLSTFAYQGYGRGLGADRLRPLNEVATGGLVPDLYLLLDLPVERGLERQRREEGRRGDRIESEGHAFLERVAGGYRDLARDDERVETVDAGGAPAEVHGRLRTLLTARFPGTFPPAPG